MLQYVIMTTNSLVNINAARLRMRIILMLLLAKPELVRKSDWVTY